MNLSQLVAGVFGMTAFVLSVLAGIQADNAFETVLTRALIACVGCYVIGFIVGTMGTHVAKEHAQRIADKVAQLDAERLDANGMPIIPAEVPPA